ncbi:hypothetical protein QBC41DRAFT_270533 [Cercophora samala]|uniref:Uncharacterized protein n=1 Tax=Cercophora samala TaxID=330535 RepID=A0AA39ZI30_9PEZI|nr:hypothetical protein QBC41DRAFT_270533 [Cercophora samala]
MPWYLPRARVKPSSLIMEHLCFSLLKRCLGLLSRSSHLLTNLPQQHPSATHPNMRINTAIACMGLVQLSWAAKKCYYPNGLEATTDTPCDPDAEDSMCCFKGGSYGRACLSNKMCQAPDGKIIRGTCTDRNWNSPECASFCMNVDGGGANLISCSNVTDKDTSFCCEKTETGKCCDDGIGRFDVMPPRPVTLALWDSSEGVYTPVAQVLQSSSTSTTTTSATTPTTESSSTTETGAGGPRETGSGSNNSSGGSTRDGSTGGSGQDTASSSSSGGLPVAAQVGIGAGVAAVVILLSVIAWLIWKLNKTKRYLVEPATPFFDPTQQQPSPYVQEWYKQQQQQQQQQHQSPTELRTGRDWDQPHHGATTPGSAELAHYGPQISAELPAGSNRYS